VPTPITPFSLINAAVSKSRAFLALASSLWVLICDLGIEQELFRVAGEAVSTTIEEKHKAQKTT
jgi:hypothetical protein